MHIAFVSFAWMRDRKDPEGWLKELDFYTGILERMASQVTVSSVHSIDAETDFSVNGVRYIFHRQSFVSYWIPFRMSRLVKQLNPDAIVVHGLHFPWHTLFLYWRLGRSVPVHVQHHAERPLSFPKNIIQRFADSAIASYFFTAIELAADWVKSRQIQTPDKIHEVMEASSIFEPMDVSAARQATGIGGSQNYLWVGRWDDNKDPYTLLRAFVRFLRTNPHARLHLIGLEKRPEAEGGLHPNITFYGRKTHDEMLHWYNSVQYIVSTSHYEGSGISVCEAMSCGCIPILTNIPSFRMMTDDGSCGLLFPPGDEDALNAMLARSAEMDVPAERTRVLGQFQRKLSFEAIAQNMIAAVRGS